MTANCKFHRYLAFAALFILLSASVYAIKLESIDASPSSGKAPLEVSFKAKIKGSGDYAYEWNLGDGFTSTKNEFSHTYESEGTYTVSLKVTDNSDGEEETKTTTITVEKAEPLVVSISANPVSGTAPLDVVFVTAVTGEAPFVYEWDFNEDDIVDSRIKDPTYTYTEPGVYEANLVVTDAAGTKNKEGVDIAVKEVVIKINLKSYSPKSFKINEESSINIIIENTGEDHLNDIDAKLLSDKIIFHKSTIIGSLPPEESDIITVTFTPTTAGRYDLKPRILGKDLSIKIDVIDEKLLFNATELENNINDIKIRLDAYDKEYYEKKSKYVLGDVVEQIKSVRSGIQTSKQNIYAGKLSEANSSIAMMEAQLMEIDNDLKTAEKIKKTIPEILKENAVLITTVLAAATALAGLFAKMFMKARHIGKKVKHGIKKKVGKKKGSAKKAGKKKSSKIKIPPQAVDDSKSEEEES